MIFGIVIGFLASISGIGGGIFFVPILIYLFSFSMGKAVGTSVIAVFMTMLSGTVSYILAVPGEQMTNHQWGFVYYTAGLILGISSLVGAVFGAKLTNKFSPVLLKQIFSVFLIVIVIKILFF